ncbi:hypothetical protein ACWDUN_27810 [Mycobacterium sp. NPDC003323]
MTPDVVAPVAPAAAVATRGSTIIDDRVRARLIERAVLSTPGVVARRTIIPGRTLPAVAVSGCRGAVDVQIAASWPVDSAAVLAAARSAVVRELAVSLGEQPDRVDVVIARVESDRAPAQVADAYAAGDQPDDAGVPHRRFAPKRAAGATFAGVLTALVLITVGAVAIREALLPDDPWVAPALTAVADAQWQWWTWPAAVAAAVIGSVLLVIAVKPRRHTHVSVGDHVWVPRGSENLWAEHANETPGEPR